MKFLFFSAYSYVHRNTESWSQNCLRDIEAVTDANGEQFRVYGQHAENGFRIQTADEWLDMISGGGGHDLVRSRYVPAAVRDTGFEMYPKLRLLEPGHPGI